ncbi:MAG: glycosyltransferase [Candidatus Symbiothrix sp.]|nr:glycosyltransferase [Candidatus Symbiothrix sp.]
MKLSIVTVNFNDAQGLKKTIESVVSQTFSDYEYIVIDGNSTDNSLAVIKESLGKRGHWLSEPDTGIYNAMNKGIAMAKGDYIQFLNSGDTLYSDTVLDEIFSQEHTADMLTGAIVRQYQYAEVVDKGQLYVRLKKGEQLTLMDFYLGTLPHQATFIRRDLFQKYGMYDERFRIVADWLFFLKTIGIHGVSIEYVNKIIVRFDSYGVSNIDDEKLKTERAAALASLYPPFIVKDYDFFESYHKIFRYAWGYRLLRFLQRSITVYDMTRQRVNRILKR